MTPKWRGWKEGIINEDLHSMAGAGHKKGDTVRYKRYREFDTETGFYTDNFEWHYLDQNNTNLVRTSQFLIE